MNRVNSASPKSTPLAATITEVADSYRSRGLCPKLRLTPLASAATLLEVASGDWRTYGLTLVMTAQLPGVLGEAASSASGAAILHDPRASDAWRATHLAGHPGPDAHERLALALAAVGDKTYCEARHAGSADAAAAAIGLAVAGDGLVGVYDVLTLPASRRAGLGRKVVGELLGWGSRRGARLAYLQVAAGNEAAISLYRSLGFGAAYTYEYAEPASPPAS